MTAAPTGHLMIGLLEGFTWLDRGLQKNLAALDLPNVRRLESMLLLNVAAGVQRPTDMAKKLGITRQSVNSAIRELEDKGLISLITDPSDRRCKIIQFSESGQSTHATALQIMGKLEQQLSDRLGQDQVQKLVELLTVDWGDVPLLDAKDTDMTFNSEA